MRTQTSSVMRHAAGVIAVLGFVFATASCSDFKASQLMRTANALGANAKWSEALHYYERLWVEYPGHPLVDEARLRAARIYAGPSKNPRSAIGLYRDLILSSGNEDLKVTALRELSDLYAASPESLPHAIELHEIHLRRYPNRADSPEVGLRLANLYLDAGRFGQAIETAQPLLEAHDNEVQIGALLVTGQAGGLAGHREIALGFFDQVIARTETGTAYWIAAMAGRGRVLEQLERRVEAIDTVSLLKEHHPNPDAVARWLKALQERHADLNR